MSVLTMIVESLGKILKNQSKVIALGERTLEALAAIRQQQVDDGIVLRRIEAEIFTEVSRLPAPDPITEIRMVAERTIQENDMSKVVIDYEAKLPPIPNDPKNEDVVAQRIVAEVDGVVVSTKDEPRLADVTNFTVDKGKSVTLKRSLLDDEDPPNEGEVTASQTFVARDTIRPTAPGDFGEITALGERTVEE